MKKTLTITAILFATQINSQTVTTVSGNGSAGSTNGPLASALFNGPNGVCVDSKGFIYVADAVNQAIRKIDLGAGTVTTIASSGFANPLNVTTDVARSVYVTDFLNNQIKKIDTLGNLSVFAGTGTGGSANGPNLSASFLHPSGIFYSNNTWYIADFDNSLIRKSTGGNVSTVTGLAGVGYLDGPVATAKLDHGYAITVDLAGNILFCDRSNHKIRKITPGGVVSTIAGSTAGFANGNGTAAQFNNPTGIAVDNAGIIYVADFGNHKIRQIDPLGNVTTLAGAGAGFADGVGTSAQFNLPACVVLDNTQNNIYVADYNNNRIRKIFLNRVDLGIQTINPFAKINIYPNPSNHSFFVNNTGVIDKIEITNTLGDSVYSTTEIGDGQNEIDIKNLHAGIYLIKISNMTDSRIIKFVKVN